MSTVEKCVDLLNVMTEAQALRVLGYMEALCSQSETEISHAYETEGKDPSAKFANDTEYLKSIPGMWESIIELTNAPKSEFLPEKEFWNLVHA